MLSLGILLHTSKTYLFLALYCTLDRVEPYYCLIPETHYTVCNRAGYKPLEVKRDTWNLKNKLQHNLLIYSIFKQNIEPPPYWDPVSRCFLYWLVLFSNFLSFLLGLGLTKYGFGLGQEYGKIIFMLLFLSTCTACQEVMPSFRKYSLINSQMKAASWSKGLAMKRIWCFSPSQFCLHLDSILTCP